MVSLFPFELLLKYYVYRARHSCDVAFTIAILLYLLEIMSYKGQAKPSSDPYLFLSSQTSRAILRVKDRDVRRHMTTYDSIDGVATSPLNFGFPPPHRRQFSEERLEIFDSTAPQHRNEIRKITIRHPWHGVFLAWDEYLNVVACSSANGGRNKACGDPPYWYEEVWPMNDTKSTDDSCFKLRLLTTSKRNNPTKQVAYLDVSRRDWSLKLKGQRSLLTRALTEVTGLAWEESLRVLFTDRSSLRQNRSAKRRRRRRRRCSVDATAIRDQLTKQYSAASVARQMKQLLKRDNECVFRHNNFSRGIDIITRTSWLEMTSDMKALLICHVGVVLREKLREGFLSLAASRCVRSQRWGRMVEQQRQRLLDRHLENTWRRRKHIIYGKLIKAVDSWMNDEITTFCAQKIT